MKETAESRGLSNLFAYSNDLKTEEKTFNFTIECHACYFINYISVDSIGNRMIEAE